MKAKFSIARKILLFWGISTLMVIALIGGIFLFSLNGYHEDLARQKIEDAHGAFLTFIRQREEHLKRISNEFASRSNVISILNLLSKYQDPNTYQALVYDPEKRKLAYTLETLTGISAHHYMAVYDSQQRLAAFHGHDTVEDRVNESTAIVSYVDARPVYYEAHQAQAATTSIAVLPHELKVPMDSFDPGTFLYVSREGLGIVVRTPIERKRVNGDVEFLGTMVLIDMLDASVLAGLMRQTGLQIGYFYRFDTALEIVGSTEGIIPAGLKLPSALEGDSAHTLVKDRNGYVGLTSLSPVNGAQVVLSFQLPDASYATGVSVFRDSALWGIAIFLLGMTPVGLIFINRVVQRPLASLIAGVESIVDGRYGDAIALDSNDELGIVAKSFNDMSRVIKERADGLEDTVRERTQALRAEIAERRLVEDALKETEAKTRQIVNSAVDGIITTDQDGKILSFNTSAEKIFGYSVIEVIGQNISILMPRHIAEKHHEYVKDYLETGKSKVIGVGRELIARRKDGSTFLADFSISDFHHGDDVTFVGIIRDITERKQEEYRLQATLEELQNTQNELVQAEKMASLGGLVAGVAHEINTPIGVGVTAVSHLKESADRIAQLYASGGLRKSDFAAFVETATASTGIIQANLNRASELIKSFKQVAVDRTSEARREVNVLAYVEEVLESLKPTLRRTKHEISISGKRDVVIDTHPGALSQIITNLVMNSVIHAYDEDDAGHIQISVEDNGGTVSLFYADDGKGMDEDVRSKIFEPFFTTKRGSGGSGLGMHILFNQVTQTLGGTIELHSTPGRGTAFEISIPYKANELRAGE
ncbi:PAS domain S-box protein [Magnetovibrio sp.]|uniref:PAS domain S-box protein n=1 Tax=Magnetovibrio sp. TaxID=2024836 RepID=UPI002F91C963